MTDELREVALHEMERRILMGFALNSGRHLHWMSPAESMSSCAVDTGKGENHTWKDAICRLVDRGVVEMRRLEAGGCSIPVFGVLQRSQLPVNEAGAMRLRMLPSERQRRVLRPIAR
jgi:hypothetical protein